MQILFLMANGFEETEFVTPFDYFQRAKLNVTLASINESIAVAGAHGLKIVADTLLKDLSLNNFDAIVLPGGGVGVQNLLASEKVLETVKFFEAKGKWIFAICAAPLVLSKANILKMRKCTCYPGCEKDLICKEFLTERVVVDNKIITSRGAGCAEEFSLECIANILDKTTAEIIRTQIVAR